MAIVGDPLDPATTVGPMARTDLRDELHNQVVRSVVAGARLVLGGEVPDGPGAFYPPPVIADVARRHGRVSGGDVRASCRHCPVDGLDEAVAVANDSDFGLGAAIFTGDIALGERVAQDRLEAGSCFVNAFVSSDPRLPLGGVKLSG